MKDYFKNKAEALVDEFVKKAEPLFKEIDNTKLQIEQELQDVQKEKDNLKELQDDHKKDAAALAVSYNTKEKELDKVKNALNKEMAKQIELNEALQKSVNKQLENENIADATKTVAEGELAKRKALKTEYENKLNALNLDTTNLDAREKDIEERRRKVAVREDAALKTETKNKEEQTRLDKLSIDIQTYAENVDYKEKKDALKK